MTEKPHLGNIIAVLSIFLITISLASGSAVYAADSSGPIESVSSNSSVSSSNSTSPSKSLRPHIKDTDTTYATNIPVDDDSISPLESTGPEFSDEIPFKNGPVELEEGIGNRLKTDTTETLSGTSNERTGVILQLYYNTSR
ncbi:MAG: hypothetical protein U5J64_07885 [Halobacteriales archaeon]|nr:hypothetical protein [Halobacteriales archaeon]